MSSRGVPDDVQRSPHCRPEKSLMTSREVPTDVQRSPHCRPEESPIMSRGVPTIVQRSPWWRPVESLMTSRGVLTVVQRSPDDVQRSPHSRQDESLMTSRGVTTVVQRSWRPEGSPRSYRCGVYYTVYVCTFPGPWRDQLHLSFGPHNACCAMNHEWSGWFLKFGQWTNRLKSHKHLTAYRYYQRQ